MSRVYVDVTIAIQDDTVQVRDPSDGHLLSLTVAQAINLRDTLNEWLPYYKDNLNLDWAKK